MPFRSALGHCPRGYGYAVAPDLSQVAVGRSGATDFCGTQRQALVLMFPCKTSCLGASVASGARFPKGVMSKKAPHTRIVSTGGLICFCSNEFEMESSASHTGAHWSSPVVQEQLIQSLDDKTRNCYKPMSS